MKTLQDYIDKLNKLNFKDMYNRTTTFRGSRTFMNF